MNDSLEVGSSEPAFWPRLSVYDGRAIEQALAPPTLFSAGLRLAGAVTEATFALGHPPLLDRLREVESPYLIDPMSLRFTSPAFRDVNALRALPYAPDDPLTPDTNPEPFTRTALEFQASLMPGAYVTPTVAWPGRSEAWHDFNARIVRVAADINGVVVERRPLAVLLAPDWDSLRQPDRIVSPLRDIPLAAAYVQPTLLRPTHDSVEKLVKYVQFLQATASLGIPVIAGRVGAFGLVLQAIGIPFFDSGLGEAESFSLATLNRPREETGSRSGGGRKRRVYIEPLKTTLLAEDVDAILKEPELRSRFICQEQCCRWTGWEGLADRRRSHYLHVRTSEVAQLSALPTVEMRLERVHQQLLEARDHGLVVRRMLAGRHAQPPNLTHLDRWLSVLARVAGISAAA